jgi:uncharacterized protein (DUF433 family)
LLERVVVDQDICFGKPCIRGTRIWVSLIMDNLAAGVSEDEILSAYPTLEKNDIRAAITYAAELAHDRIAERKSGRSSLGSRQKSHSDMAGIKIKAGVFFIVVVGGWWRILWIFRCPREKKLSVMDFLPRQGRCAILNGGSRKSWGESSAGSGLLYCSYWGVKYGHRHSL